ncbi:MAG: hypothetical protein FWC54_03710 [Actinomycetia bacterium]|nr:hypothetical protein [Actinomycetes bacterium]
MRASGSEQRAPSPDEPVTWTARFAVVRLHSFTDGTLRLYYEPRPGAPTTTEGLDVRPLFEVLPGLRRHRCDNGRHRSFFDEARRTELAHLLEHVLIELLATRGQARARIRGATNLDEAPARYRVKVSGWTSSAQAGECIEKALLLLERPKLCV